MFSTIKLINEVKKSIKKDTIYSLAKVIGADRNTVRYWLKGGVISDKYALRCAEITGLDKDYVLYSVNLERAQKSQENCLISYWQSKLDKIKPSLAASACVLWAIGELLQQNPLI
ncbi:hypothetical protein [Candidatus Sororendozoicomonas aggregata]|uniref:hypothetical protein n=1 Tax=Candidatus Sororendozoicomonas aggregata TaxID=3073239 RepID=UPI002ED6A362